MRSVWCSALAVVAGCDIFFPLTGPTSDAGIDAPGLCYGTDLLQLCLESPPVGPFAPPDGLVIITESDSACVAYTVEGIDPAVCVIAGTTILIDGVLRASGSKPLVLVSASTLVVNGTVDVSSTDALRGAGSSDKFDGSDCPELEVVAASTAGGAGGSFATLGGIGSQTGFGRPAPVVAFDRLRAGCRGGGGGAPSINTFGQGGGAVGLIATSISILGSINASGMAGRGGGAIAGGGGGGGSGGMILLDGDVQMAATAQVFANGGGGGEGAGNSAGNNGCPGKESPGALLVGQGGADPGVGCGSINGDNGGNGAGAGGSLAGASGNPDGDASGGGGGGGGGVGVIRVAPPQALGGLVSPPPS